LDARRQTVVALALLCAGCQWTGGGFHADGPEMPRLRQVLKLEKTSIVADFGAGKGELTFALAAEVRQVFATEIDPGRLQRLRDARLANVTVAESLPPSCCDAIVVRRVYHHLADVSAVNASLFRSLHPGGVLAIIDFPPPFFLSRGGFGVPPDDVVAEVKSSGFELVGRFDDWPGRGPLPSYCLVFRKP
jgi:SAM-dependent methyltransferase